MATVRVAGNASGDLEVLEEAVRKLDELAAVIAETGSAAARQAILESVASQRGGTLSMSGLGATLDVETTLTVGDGAAQAALTPTPPGAWAIVDRGTRRHTQKVGGLFQPRGMPTGLGGIYAKVDHPGAAGLHVAGPATDAAEVATEQAAQSAVDALPSG